MIALFGGEGQEACHKYRESLRNAKVIGNLLEALLSFEGYAWALSTSAHRIEAVRLLGAAAKFRKRTGAPVFPLNQPMYDRVISELKNELEEEDFSRAWAEGEATDIEMAMAIILGND